MMVYIPDMLPMASKELQKTHFKVTMSWATSVEEGSRVSLGFGGLRDDLGFVVGEAGLLVMRAVTDSLVLGKEGPLQCVSFMMLVIGSLNWMVLSSWSSSSCCGGNCHGGKCDVAHPG